MQLDVLDIYASKMLTGGHWYSSMHSKSTTGVVVAVPHVWPSIFASEHYNCRKKPRGTPNLSALAVNIDSLKRASLALKFTPCMKNMTPSFHTPAADPLQRQIFFGRRLIPSMWRTSFHNTTIASSPRMSQTQDINKFRESYFEVIFSNDELKWFSAIFKNYDFKIKPSFDWADEFRDLLSSLAQLAGKIDAMTSTIEKSFQQIEKSARKIENTIQSLVDNVQKIQDSGISWSNKPLATTRTNASDIVTSIADLNTYLNDVAGNVDSTLNNVSTAIDQIRSSSSKLLSHIVDNLDEAAEIVALGIEVENAEKKESDARQKYWREVAQNGILNSVEIVLWSLGTWKGAAGATGAKAAAAAAQVEGVDITQSNSWVKIGKNFVTYPDSLEQNLENAQQAADKKKLSLLMARLEFGMLSFLKNQILCVQDNPFYKNSAIFDDFVSVIDSINQSTTAIAKATKELLQELIDSGDNSTIVDIISANADDLDLQRVTYHAMGETCVKFGSTLINIHYGNTDNIPILKLLLNQQS